jgi:hypothetical protein
MMDPRDLAHTQRWWNSITPSRKLATATLWFEDEDGGYEETVDVPVTFVVCALCDGTGRHVNPSIDAHGLSREDFEDDPDFLEDYFNGIYDVICYLCKGANVVPVASDPKLLKAIKDKRTASLEVAAEYEAERRVGA